MVFSAKHLVWIGVLATAKAASLEHNPVTQVATEICLNKDHPAYGAEPPSSSTAYLTVIKEEPKPSAEPSNPTSQPPATNSSDNPAKQSAKQSFRRRLELSTNGDIQRLEEHFGEKLERDVTKLAVEGTWKPTPWPSSYWPVYQDSINYRWKKDEASPAEKYAKAFGLDVKEFMDKVSKNNGVDSQAGRRSCQEDSECTSLKDGSACAKREGQGRGYCIPQWFGVCHAWSPAALLEKEPRCPVEKNGVTFRPMDIKGLVTLVYDGADVPTVFTGARFNGPDDAPNNKDEFGRFRDAARRDLGPGYFHLAITNILSRFNTPFVVDVTAGAEVWNQPVRGFQVRDWEWMQPEEGARRYFDTDKYPFNNDATWLLYVKTNFRWIVESLDDGPLVETGAVDESTRDADHEYVLEIDDSLNVLGGEWVGKSKDEHPDFLWFPTKKPAADAVTSIGISYKEVSDLIEASVNGDC
ncbi:TPA: hypothetical protein N0F65_000651 [Lagenidium giganteum]|uniref:Uncharacterized protein n=1 Tax=Lagenidium giganteum TaxID=4803 RepID=A0AAV2YRZ5_9STRA|nr:TPA: hypothetical protein N0F65_000651 [Lagenidium giganteum]